MLPTKHYMCVVCGNEANIEADRVAPGIITWPVAYCEDCPSHPKMVTNNNIEVITHAG